MTARDKLALVRQRAGFKAAATLRRRKARERTRRKKAAEAAWVKMRSAPFKARRTAFKSQDALQEWAKAKGWYVVFLDAPSGHPRTGIVDAVLLRTATNSPDQLEVRLVQLKGGSGGLTASEVTRLARAADSVDVKTLCALHDGQSLHLQASWDVAPKAASRSR